MEPSVHKVRKPLEEMTREELIARVTELEDVIVWNKDGSLWTCNCCYCQGHGDWCVCGCGADPDCPGCGEPPYNCVCEEEQDSKALLDSLRRRVNYVEVDQRHESTV